MNMLNPFALRRQVKSLEETILKLEAENRALKKASLSLSSKVKYVTADLEQSYLPGVEEF